MCFVYLLFLQTFNLSSLFIYYILSLKLDTFEMQYYCYMVLKIIISTKVLSLLKFMMECTW
jgi:hypothetical protein